MRFVKTSCSMLAVVAIGCSMALAADPAPSTQPTTGPATTQAATTQPTNILLTSWEGSMDGWHIFTEDAPGGQPEANGVSFSTTTGVTDGKQALAVQIKEGFRKSLRVDDVKIASQLKGHKLSLDITATPDSAGGSFLQIAISGVADGMPWAMVPVKPVVTDGKPHTMIFNTSKWRIPDHPQYFGLWIITNTGGDAKTGTVYFDNLRIVD